MRLVVNEKDLEKILVGSAFLGGGGGGSIEEGMKLGKTSLLLGDVVIVSLDELDKQGVVVTASSVASQVAGKNVLKPFNYIEAAWLMRGETGNLVGVVSSEIGGLNTVASWIQAASLGVYVVDAPCDGRAHPTVLMGSLGLHRLPSYTSIQAFSTGGLGSNHVSGVLRGSLDTVSRSIRSIAATHGVVAVSRNPVNVEYLEKNAAVGAVSLALKIGEILIDQSDSLEALHRVTSMFRGVVIPNCVVKEAILETRGGFDVGRSMLECSEDLYELTYINEFMTLESKRRGRVATFPDLITLVRKETPRPVLSAELSRGLEVHMAIIDRHRIPLGAGLKYHEAYSLIEEILGKPIISFISDILLG